MRKVIIVGGPSRAGTNTVSAFLHLHDDITMYCTPAGAFAFSAPGLWKQCQSVSGPARLQQAIRLNSRWPDIFSYKNKMVLDGMKTPIYGVRYDYAEKMLEGKVDEVPTYFVYCMRNLKDLYLSQAFHGFIKNGVEQFESNIQGSLDEVRKISKVFPIDVSEGADYSGLIQWLGLEMTFYQKEWAEENPVTNRAKGSYEAYMEFREEGEVEISEGLIQRYKDVKTELLGRL